MLSIGSYVQNTWTNQLIQEELQPTKDFVQKLPLQIVKSLSNMIEKIEYAGIVAVK